LADGLGQAAEGNSDFQQILEQAGITAFDRADLEVVNAH